MLLTQFVITYILLIGGILMFHIQPTVLSKNNTSAIYIYTFYVMYFMFFMQQVNVRRVTKHVETYRNNINTRKVKV
jgi:hypothetical protein